MGAFPEWRVLTGCLALLACSVASPLRAQDSEEFPYLIPAIASERPSAKEAAAITAAICDGKADDDHCDSCPGGSSLPGIGFSLGRVIFGHFVGADSEDAFVTVSGCEEKHASIGWGFLVTRRAGTWKSLEEVLGLVLDNCHGMRFRSGRQLLVCEDYLMDQFNLMHNVTAVFAKGESIGFRHLLTATDTTRMCSEQPRPQKAQIDKIEFRDLNGDGIEDVALTVSFGMLADSERRQQLCQDAQDDKPGVRRPQPKVMKSYRIEYLFDGLRFTLTKASQAAAKLFEWEN